MERPIFVPDVLVVESRFRTRVEERVVNIRRDVEITVDGAVAEFDFKRAEPFAVAHRRERR